MSTILGKLDFALERDLVIRAPRKLVFQYFTDSGRFARWWGAGSSIEPRVGGAVVIVQPGGPRAVGSVVEIKHNERIVFTYGYEGANALIPPAGSRVAITLYDDPKGTRLHLLHEVADTKARDAHVQGWRFQLSVFANVVASEAHAPLQSVLDAWFTAWNEPDAAARRNAFAAIVADDVDFHDAFSNLHGLDDLDAQVTAGKVHMPGITIERSGAPRHCQGTFLVDWTAKAAQGVTIATGTNVFEFALDGRLARVTGFWNAPAGN